MRAPNVLVLSRTGEVFGICCDRAREVSVTSQNDIHQGSQEDKVYHVISDVLAEGSSFVVDKCRRVTGKGRQADVQHVLVLGREGKGCGGEWRLLMLSNVVKFTLCKEETAGAFT